MEIGAHGVRGARAVKHVNKGSSQELVNATHQSLSMVVKSAKGTPKRQSFVKRTSLAQVMKFNNL